MLREDNMLIGQYAEGSDEALEELMTCRTIEDSCFVIICLDRVIWGL